MDNVGFLNCDNGCNHLELANNMHGIYHVRYLLVESNCTKDCFCEHQAYAVHKLYSLSSFMHKII